MVSYIGLQRSFVLLYLVKVHCIAIGQFRGLKRRTCELRVEWTWIYFDIYFEFNEQNVNALIVKSISTHNYTASKWISSLVLFFSSAAIMYLSCLLNKKSTLIGATFVVFSGNIVSKRWSQLALLFIYLFIGVFVWFDNSKLQISSRDFNLIIKL